MSHRTAQKSQILFMSFLCFLCLFVAPNGITQEKWRLVWSDEFDYNGLPDPKKWSYDVGGHGWGNKEWEYYPEGRKENGRVENGLLIIEARRDSMISKPFSTRA